MGQKSFSDDDLPTWSAALVPYSRPREESPKRTSSSRPDHSPNDEQPRRRRSSDPSSDRPTSLHRRSKRSSSSDSDSDAGTVEELPDRFDSEGRPLDRPRFSRRAGKWEKRDSQGRSHEKGAWVIEGGGIGDGAEVMERVVKEVADVLDGKNSWLVLVQGVLSGGLLEAPEHHHRRRSQSEHGERDREYLHRNERDYGGSKRRGDRRESEAPESRKHHHEDDESDRDREREHGRERNPEPKQERGSDRERGSERGREVGDGQNNRSRRRRRQEDEDDDALRNFGHRRRLSLNDDDVIWGSGTYDDPNDATAKR